MSGVISSILAAAEKAEREGRITPQFVRLPSFIYRAAYDEARTTFGGVPCNGTDLPSFIYRAAYDEARTTFGGVPRNGTDYPGVTSFNLGQICISGAQDGT